MAEDDKDRANETEAEREAEITAEMERVGQDPDQVQEGSENLGTQNAPSGELREDATEEDEAEEAEEEEPKDEEEEEREAVGTRGDVRDER